MIEFKKRIKGAEREENNRKNAYELHQRAVIISYASGCEGGDLTHRTGGVDETPARRGTAGM